jgi:hypothetical protein
MTPLVKNSASLLTRAIFRPYQFFLSPFLSKHNHETQNTLPTHPNNCEPLTGTIPNMLMRRFVGGGDEWCVHMDVMAMVFQGCTLINLTASPSARPLLQPHSSGIMNTTIKSR